jgi:hypothetical protein
MKAHLIAKFDQDKIAKTKFVKSDVTNEKSMDGHITHNSKNN